MPGQPATLDKIHPDLEPLAFPTALLDPLPGNPNLGDVDAVARSYQQFGQRKPIVARRNGPRGTVLAGNTQLAAATTRLGWDRIAVVWTDDDDATAKAYALADNRTAELGTTDDAALAALLADIQDAGDADLLAATAFDPDEIARLLAAASVEPGDGDPDAVPDLPAAPITRSGDVWLLGPHRLVCGDSTDPAVYATLLEGRVADLVWTDPPYGVDVTGGTKDALTIANDNLTPQKLGALLEAALGNAARHSRPGAAWYVAAGDRNGPFQQFLRTLTDLGIYRHLIVWVKDRFVMSAGDYHFRHEVVLYGWRPGAAHDPVLDRTQDTVWEIPRPSRSEQHPTMKPVALVARAIGNHGQPGALVLDPFAGSGTTLIAANDLQRVAALIELDPRYVDVICHRWQDHTGVVPILEATSEPRDFTQPVPA